MIMENPNENGLKIRILKSWLYISDFDLDVP